MCKDLNDERDPRKFWTKANKACRNKTTNKFINTQLQDEMGNLISHPVDQTNLLADTFEKNISNSMSSKFLKN